MKYCAVSSNGVTKTLNMTIVEFLNIFNSTYCSDSLDFEIVETNIDVRKIYPNEKEFHQIGYEIIPSHKTIRELPKGCHPDITIEQYQEIINNIDLNVFHCYCLWSMDGIVISNKRGEICFQASWEFLKKLEINIEW